MMAGDAVEIRFKNKKLRECCNNFTKAVQQWGLPHAKKIIQRLNELWAADTLADMGHLPPARCHELTGDRKGQFAVTTTEPNRLIFTPDHDPVPIDGSGGIDRSKVTDIVILEVEDYHGKGKKK